MIKLVFLREIFKERKIKYSNLLKIKKTLDNQENMKDPAYQ